MMGLVPSESLQRMLSGWSAARGCGATLLFRFFLPCPGSPLTGCDGEAAVTLSVSDGSDTTRFGVGLRVAGGAGVALCREPAGVSAADTA